MNTDDANLASKRGPWPRNLRWRGGRIEPVGAGGRSRVTVTAPNSTGFIGLTYVGTDLRRCDDGTTQLSTANRALISAGFGDRAAFAIFYDATAAVVYGMVLQMLRDPGRSEEVAQEIFLKAWRHAGHFDARRETACQWIIARAHRHVVDQLRSDQTGSSD